VDEFKSKDPAMPTIRSNWFDRTVEFFSPKAGLRRKKAKIHNAYLKRKYEGADAGRRTAGWNTNNQSANAEIATGGIKLRDRARDMVRNNPYAARGVQAIANNVVGRGIKTQIKIDTRAKVSDKEKRANNSWNTWSGTTACDYEGIHNFAGLQRICMRAVAESGEVFVRKRRVKRQFRRGKDGKRIEVPPIQLQVLEADFLSTNSRSGILPNGNQVIQGVELDKTGKRVAYHMFLSHPGSNDVVFASRFSTVRVPADEVLHLYRADRPGQLRGATWLASIMLRLRDFDLFEDAQLKRQQCAAMFAGFIHDIEGIDDAEETKQEVELADKMEPGMLELLPPGKEITLARPPGAENYGEFTTVVLHSVATGLGITYAQLTGNLAEVNFSSGRIGFLESHRNFDTWRNNIMLLQLIDPAFDWFAEGMELIGVNMSGARPVHTAPKREMIDPSKEIAALKTAVRSGFKSQSDAIRETGADPDTHYQELADDNATIDRLKLTLDTDPRKVNNTGTTNSDDDTETPPPPKTKKVTKK
jgi:lambda family phage portal protein